MNKTTMLVGIVMNPDGTVVYHVTDSVPAIQLLAHVNHVAESLRASVALQVLGATMPQSRIVTAGPSIVPPFGK